MIFFVTAEAKSQQQLPEEFQLAALDHLFENLESKIAVTRDVFINKICRPLKLISIWKTAKIKTNYGELATNSIAFQKLTASLKFESAMLNKFTSL